jgi:hypothetical protein
VVLLLALAGGGVAVLAAGLLLAGWYLLPRSRSGGADDDRKAREAMLKINDVPPIAWTLKPGPAPTAGLPDQFTLADTQTAIPVGWENLFVVKKQDRWLYGRFDLKTGRADGEPVALAEPFDAELPHAFSPSGAAVVTDSKKTHLDYYEPGGQAPKPLPAPGVRFVTVDTNNRQGDLSWFEFSADGKLWHLLDGKLAAWDLKAGTAVIEAPRRYAPLYPSRGFALMGPDRKWLVAQVEDKYLEVLDAATGECRGRLGGEGGWRALALSPDGTRLAGARAGSNPYHNPQDSLFAAELHEWDLTTGEKKGMTSFITNNDGLNNPRALWYTPDRLWLGRRSFDMKRRVHLIDFPLPDSGLTFCPDGRVWSARAEGRVTSLKLPTDPPEGEPALGPGDALRVEAHCGDASIDRRVTALMGETLGRLGYRVEPGGWALRVSAQVEDTKEKVTGSFGDYAVPIVRSKYELVAPDGTVAATKDQVVICPLGSFFKSANYAPGGVIQPGGAHQVNYDFGGRNPATAMREEVWNRFVRTMPEEPWPRTVWRSGGKYLSLPITIAGPE